VEFQDYYKTLGVPRTASQAEIKKAFRKLARESHPDKHPGDKAAERRFKDVNEANAVLSDPSKREKFDRFGKDWAAYERAGAAGAAGAAGGNPFGPNGPFAGYTSGSRTGPGGVRYEFRTSGDSGGFSDFFRMMFGDEGAAAGEPERFSTHGGSMDDILAGLGYASATRGGSRSGNDRVGQARLAPVEATAEITLDEAYHGTTRLIDVEGKRLEITIPPGADTGSRIKLSGRGPGGGDLIVVVKMSPDRRFTRRGADLERDLPLTLQEALLGGEVPVTTLKGRVLLTIPAGTQPGRTFRLNGQGMPRFKVTGHGDLYVKARVVLPAGLTDEARAAAKAFFDLVDQPDPR